MFRHIEGPFGIISVAGMYRTGKSYLLNKVLLDRKKGEQGFGVGPSINPCTKVSEHYKTLGALDMGYPNFRIHSRREAD
jgi:hypothetical protein